MGLRRYNSLPELIEALKHEHDDNDLSDSELFTSDVMDDLSADAELDLNDHRPAKDAALSEPHAVRWQARRWH